jgi:oxaloacetate decarboxylase alpha subunit
MADKYPQLVEEMPRVRADLGYPPLVTPTSQIVGSMSAFNVMLGRYQVVPIEVKDLARGKYGRTPAPVSEELRKLIGDLPIITHRPADDIPPQLPAMAQKLAEKGFPGASMEDVLSFALFPEVAVKFFEANRKRAA